MEKVLVLDVQQIHLLRLLLFRRNFYNLRICEVYGGESSEEHSSVLEAWKALGIDEELINSTIEDTKLEVLLQWS
ncbi:MAG: hypothetical protein H6572_11785 [Lewinellaceae bacterium]|nr:hypothetical protein [Lewinellaceae bacterium]